MYHETEKESSGDGESVVAGDSFRGREMYPTLESSFGLGKKEEK